MSKRSYNKVDKRPEDPDIALAIVSIIFPFVMPIPVISLILAYVARNVSNKKGYRNSVANASIVLNWIMLVLVTLVFVFLIYIFVDEASKNNYTY